jgi:hypothetical protein
MSRNEVKEKIQTILEKLNDDKLIKALEVLKTIEEKEGFANLKSNLEKILEEDKNLLNRLAQ